MRILNSMVVVSNPAASRSARKLFPNFHPSGCVWSDSMREPVKPYITAFECLFVAPSPPHMPMWSGPSPGSFPKKNRTSPGFACRLVARIQTFLRCSSRPTHHCKGRCAMKPRIAPEFRRWASCDHLRTIHTAGRVILGAQTQVQGKLHPPRPALSVHCMLRKVAVFLDSASRSMPRVHIGSSRVAYRQAIRCSLLNPPVRQAQPGVPAEPPAIMLPESR